MASYIPLALTLRQQLVQVTCARSASQGKSEKMELVYEYLAGDAFRHKVEAIVETCVGMQEQLNKEKRAGAGEADRADYCEYGGDVWGCAGVDWVGGA